MNREEWELKLASERAEQILEEMKEMAEDVKAYETELEKAVAYAQLIADTITDQNMATGRKEFVKLNKMYLRIAHLSSRINDIVYRSGELAREAKKIEEDYNDLIN